ncbi:YtxH domain-containing protein [Persicimonas caeni]|uniref:YtxH domain-containing protein n=1 Tax=Persicimonas caeni TaxID=2292766 RepID=A0A4Y6PQI1_PERCE|nr:YtxH domain-containing protein [Persicimonas caeni]QDG50473.1 YtxH domain-containing protein [Persicimonas caeni]QED31694.1 YtxH domain-containing protein [Persicimonas caeni]
MNLSNPFSSDNRRDRYDQLIDRVGLQRKTSNDNTLAAIGLFAMGLGLGATLGMLFAPKEGREIRQQAKEKLPGIRSGSSIESQERIYEQRT